jgi:ubiquinone/menaquinone biosynthesis C-methylase UbiE
LINNAPTAGNIEYRVGNIIDLDMQEPEFDQVVMDMLIHHLAGKNFKITRQNVSKAFSNAHRVLKPGGEIIIMESCLPKVFERIEIISFPIFKFITSLLGHPAVLQWNWLSLKILLEEAGFKELTLNEVKLGRWIIHLGFKIPTKISPVRAYIIKATK